MNLLLVVCSLVAAKASTAAVLEDYNPTSEDLGAASYFNTSTSSFIKIIKTEDVRTRDPIYATPAVMFIGKVNGQILRCLLAEPLECEVFFEKKIHVHALLIFGEYIYASLMSGVILKCDLYKKESCINFYFGSSETLSLSVGGGYLYASQYTPPIILRCDLTQPYSCRPLQKMKNSHMWAFTHFGKYMFVGQHDGKVLRCSSRDNNSCTELFNMNSPVYGFANIGDSIFAITVNGNLWNCSRKANATIDSCRYVATHLDSPLDIASFNDQLYVVNKEGVYICKWTNNTSCTQFAKHEGVSSIAIAYETYNMQSRYKDEETTCSWQSNYKCPPFVSYYGAQVRNMLEVHVRNGRLYNSQGFLVDTRFANEGHSGPAAIFAMGPDGKLLLSNVHLNQLIHTSSFFAGNPVAGAGEMTVINGVIKKMAACDKHYRADADLNKQVIQSLRMQGYTDPIESQTCGEDEENGQIESSQQSNNPQ